MSTDPELPHEQFLELLSANVASNERLLTKLAQVEKSLPEKIEQVFTNHREKISGITVTPAPVKLPDLTPVFRRQREITHAWSIFIALLVFIGTAACIFLIARVH